MKLPIFKKKEKNIKPELISWVQQALLKVDKKAVKEQLIKSGYAAPDIRMAFIEAENSSREQEKVLEEVKLEVRQNIAEAQEKQVVTKDVQIFDEKQVQKGYHPFKDMAWYSIKKRKMKKLEQKYPDRTVLADIEMNNGFHRLILVREREGGFELNGKLYIFDNTSKYYVIDAGFWCYSYHEEYSLPIKKEFQFSETAKEIVIPIPKRLAVQEIRTAIENTKNASVILASYPSVLYNYTKARLAENILQGVQMDEIFRFLKLMVIIILIIVAIILLFQILSSGMFDKLTGMFHKPA